MDDGVAARPEGVERSGWIAAWTVPNEPDDVNSLALSFDAISLALRL